jgi:hypothetical protein
VTRWNASWPPCPAQASCECCRPALPSKPSSTAAAVPPPSGSRDDPVTGTLAAPRCHLPRGVARAPARRHPRAGSPGRTQVASTPARARPGLDKLNDAIVPAAKARLQVRYGVGAGEIGQRTGDIKSGAIGLAGALVTLLIMFWSLTAAAIPLVSAIFSVLAGLALLALLARDCGQSWRRSLCLAKVKAGMLASLLAAPAG